MSDSEVASAGFTFNVADAPRWVPSTARNKGFLVNDSWDDWGRYGTLFSLIVFDDESVKHEIGYVKIGQFQMPQGLRRPAIPHIFVKLSDEYFSLGQDRSYYETLSKISERTRISVLDGLHDLVADESRWRRACHEDVTKISLLRSVTPKSVEGQFRRLLNGLPRLTEFKFNYSPPGASASEGSPYILTFDVKPETHPPTNLHVLIGRNGVGKSRILNLMTLALVGEPSINREYGEFSSDLSDGSSSQFANLVSVSFSAFDDFRLLPEKKDKTDGIQYSYIGLRRTSVTGNGIGRPKSADMLAKEFAQSVRVCLKSGRAIRWRKALQMLEADPVFRDSGAALLMERTTRKLRSKAISLFNNLSSGHKIVLLTMSRLVETVEEKTLVILDEPEAHLHPPLLAAFVRSLSALMIDRNGVAIIATHSPVILQEIPKTCVWVLQRLGDETRAERPQTETFGENVGVLTREVFRLEVSQSGFHRMLSEAADRHSSFEEVIEYFNNELGAEARAILRGLFAAKDTQDTD